MQLTKTKPVTRHVCRRGFGIAAILCILLTLNMADHCKAGEDVAADEDVVFKIRVVIKFAASPIFSQLFKRSVLRHVRGQLNGYFGPLADCKILATNDDYWLTDKIEHAGSEDLEIQQAWLPTPQNGVPEKVAFAHIDYAQSAYRVRLQMADVETGWISPLRTRPIPDRQMVAQVICDMFLANFPISISLKKLTANDDSQLASVTLKGGSRMRRIQSKIDKSPYFKIYAKQTSRDGTVKRTEIEDTVLHYDPSDANSTGKVISSLSNAFYYPDSEYEGISLPTQEGSVRLQIVDRTTRRAALNCVVRVSDERFGNDNSKVLGSPDRKGHVEESAVYRDLVYVTIEQGGVFLEHFPVPLIKRTVQIRREFDLDRDGAAGINLAVALRRLNSEVNSLNRSQETTKQESNGYYTDQMYEKALKLARELAEEYVDSAANIRNEYLKLGQLPADAPEWQTQIRKSVKEFLAKQDAINQENQDWVKTLENMIEHNDAKARAEAEVLLGNRAKRECGDAQEALQHYKKALEEFRNAAQSGATEDSAFAEQINHLTHEIEEIEEVWRIKGEDHREAREFVYQTLQNADDGDRIEEHLPKLKQNNYIAVLRGYCDTYTLLKLKCICDQCDETMLETLNDIRDLEFSQDEIDGIKNKHELIKEIGAEARNAIVDCQEAAEPPESDDPDESPDNADTGCIPALSRDALAMAVRSLQEQRGRHRDSPNGRFGCEFGTEQLECAGV